MSATTQLGKVSVTPQGAWSSSTAYAILDIVTNGGGSYLAKKAVPAGTALSNTEYWLQITAKGNTGNGISSISKTATAGLVDTYTITFTDSTTSTFTVTNGEDGAITADVIGTAYSASSTYAVGDYCTYNNKLYKCNTAITTAEAWTAAHWTEVSIGDELGDINEDLETKADIDGYYETLSVGLADNLIDRKGTGEEESFTFRTSGARGSITDDGNGIVQSVHGNTIAWNQFAINGDFHDETIATNHLGTLTVSNNVGSFTINSLSVDCRFGFNLLYVVSGHKYFFTQTAKTNSTGTIYANLWENGWNGEKLLLTNSWQTQNKIVVSGSTSTASDFPFCFDTSGGAVGDVIDVKNCMIIDLTQMFGSGNEPTTVAEFKAMFPLDYYAYNAGSLLSYNGTGIKTVGFNQWDEEWELGLYTNTGVKASATDYIRSKNYIHIFPSTNYYAKYTGIGIYICEYDASKSFIQRRRFVVTNGTTFTTNSNAQYITFCLAGTTYNNDICINLSWSGYRNGEYEEHWANTLALPVSTYFPNGMRSAGSVYDELTKNKAITRIGAVDLGSLDWTYDTEGTYPYFYTGGIRSVINVPTSNTAPYVCSMYYPYPADSRTYFGNNAGNKMFMVSSVGTKGFVCVRDDSYTDAAAFKTAMSGVYLFYELATATEQTISPALELVYPVSDFGTEQNLPENDDEPTTTPFDGIIKYSNDFTREVANLPKNYDSTDGLDALCTALATALGTALGGTFTITRGAYDATNKKYAFTCSYVAST